MAEVKKEQAEFTNKEVAAKYRMLNPEHAEAEKVTPLGHSALKDITPGIAAFLVKTKDADIEELSTGDDNKKEKKAGAAGASANQ